MQERAGEAHPAKLERMGQKVDPVWLCGRGHRAVNLDARPSRRGGGAGLCRGRGPVAPTLPTLIPCGGSRSSAAAGRHCVSGGQSSAFCCCCHAPASKIEKWVDLTETASGWSWSLGMTRLASADAARYHVALVAVIGPVPAPPGRRCCSCRCCLCCRARGRRGGRPREGAPCPHTACPGSRGCTPASDRVVK